MPTASGAFPKTDGDILYAYDINRMNSPCMFTGSGINVASGTSLQLVGSVLIPAGSLSVYPNMEMGTDWAYTTQNTNTAQMKIQVSGTGGNFDLTGGLNDSSGWKTFSSIFTMPPNTMIGLAHYYNGGTAAFTHVISSAAYTSGTDLVIKFYGKLDTGTGAIFYSVRNKTLI